MKTKIAALTLMLFAGCATAALAQDRDRDRGESRGEARAEHPAARQAPRAAPEFRRDAPRPDFQRRSEPAPQAQPERQAQPARPSPPERQAQPERRFEGGGRPEGFRRGGENRGGGPVAQPPAPNPGNDANRQPRGDGERRWQGRDGQSQTRDQNRGGGWDGQRREGGDRSHEGDRGRWNGGDRERHDGDRNRGDRNNDRRDGDRRDGERHDGNRGGWNRDDHGRPHWDHNRYPPVYRSTHRYRHAWRPPIGFYVRSWGYGDILPLGWYAPEYRLYDWWNYDLPAPPPGYEWVRVGYDALLVDQFDGRVVQVVRLVFY
jgi:Ni/Co efflux regulator RcnB